MTGKLIPFGYSVFDAQARLAKLMQDERAILVDVRYSVKSQNKPEWAGAKLQMEYQERYLWIKELGNINYFQHGAPIKIANPEVGIPRLIAGLEKGYTIILLCTCVHYNQCHRKVVVDLVKDLMPEVEVVQPEEPTSADTIRCISIMQPWCWLISNQLKDIENRDWNTHYRGPVLLHTGKRPDVDCFYDDGSLSPYFERKFSVALSRAMPQHKHDYTYGALIGMATLVNVVTSSSSPWFRGDYGFVMMDAKPFVEPIPYRGERGLFNVPREVIASARLGDPIELL